MKTLILYSGNLGSTAKCAEILHSMIENSTVVDTATKPTVNFNEYDNIVFGTNVRMFMLNRKFKKYAKKWLKSKCDNKAYVYILGAAVENGASYKEKVSKMLGENCYVKFVGGELNADGASKFETSVIESVKTEILSKGQPLPAIDIASLKEIASAISEK